MAKFYNAEYVEQLRQLHQNKSAFGDRADYNKFKKWIDYFNPSSIIDYGCGKGKLVNTFKQDFPDKIIQGYDPAVEEFSQKPTTTFDMLVSLDVLEHIEPDYIDNVLQDINKIITKGCYLVIATGPAKNKLPDGRNAHLIQQGPDWWKNKIKQNMDIKIVNDRYKRRFEIVLEKL
jgi:2-polyprenyl-3-methyl-5-hydroxy-6-metoxy-1,4-benzoquinol methylase